MQKPYMSSGSIHDLQYTRKKNNLHLTFLSLCRLFLVFIIHSISAHIFPSIAHEVTTAQITFRYLELEVASGRHHWH